MTTRQSKPNRDGPNVNTAFVLHPDLAGAEGNVRDADSQLQEVAGLAEAISLDIVHADVVRLSNVRPATLFGAGKVDEIGALIEAEGPEVVIVNGALTPIQHRNLERAWKAKVLDRTALILEIFGARARTKEGRLQVDLAQLTYQRSRLVRSWTHLERQRGGVGFLGGPGETQIESDRRQLSEKIERLKKQLEEVRRTRGLQRRSRARVPCPVIALVGYTNAGKSTLFNRLTASAVMAKDMLFATLDTTMRAVDLPGGSRVILSDTVGFISDLPTQLVAAFRATLEEVTEADIIIHVRDISHEETDAQKADVLTVLEDIGVDGASHARFIEAQNKIDLLPEEDRSALAISAQSGRWTAEGTMEDPRCVVLSAVTGEGVDGLLQEIERLMTRDHVLARLTLAASDGAARAWLHENANVLSEEHDGEETRFVVRIAERDAGKFEKRFAGRFVKDKADPNLIREEGAAHGLRA